MKEDYVSYEQAVKLKELEFSGETTGKYIDCPKDPTLYYGMLYQSWNLESDEIIAPTLAMAQKWLREEYGVDVLVFNCACGYGWEISKAGNEQTRGTIIMPYDENGEDEASGMWLSYEAALSAGISKCITILMED